MNKNFDLESETIMYRLFKLVKNFIDANKYTFYSALIVGLLSHGFMFANKLINHDDVNHFFDKGNSASLGRWGLDILQVIFPNYSMPWVYGIITLLLFALSACYIVKILEIRSNTYKILFGGVVSSFPALTSIYSYMFTSTTYGVAFFCSVMAVYIFRKCQHRFGFGIALMLSVFSLSIYQGLIGLLATLFFLDLCREYIIVCQEVNWKAFFKDCFKILFLLCLSVFSYAVISYVLIRLFEIEILTYGSNAVGHIGLKNIKYLYGIPIYVMLFELFGYIPSMFSKIMHGIFLGTFFVESVIFLIDKNISRSKKIGLCLMFLFLPVCLNAMYIVAKPGAIHSLVMINYVLIYCWALTVVENFELCDFIKNKTKVILRNLSGVSLMFIVFFNIFLANEAYLGMYLRYQNCFAFLNRVLYTVENYDEYTPDKKILLLGKVKFERDWMLKDKKFPEVGKITGVLGLSPNVRLRDCFLKYYVGYSGEFANEEEKRKISKTDEFKNMPIYPKVGSVRQINDIIVVKLGEVKR